MTRQGTMTSLLGKDGSPPMCKEIGEVAMHWFATDAKAGDPCLCGKTTQSPAPDDTTLRHEEDETL